MRLDGEIAGECVCTARDDYLGRLEPRGVPVCMAGGLALWPYSIT